MKPNLIIIGAAKCGTTSLHHYLDFHPEICMSKTKELQYFVETGSWTKGLSWYESNFNGVAKVFGESSPQYTHYPNFLKVPEKMFSLLPNAKLIYIIRDPIDRIVSHYYQRSGGFKEERTINEVLSSSNDNAYINQSKYFMQIQQYLKYYSKDSILIITLESLIAKKKETLETVFDFLGLNSSCYDEKHLSERLNESSKKRKESWLSKIIYPKPFRSFLPYKLKIIAKAVGKEIEKPIIDEQNFEKIVGLLTNDVVNLKAFTGNDFIEWRNISLFK